MFNALWLSRKCWAHDSPRISPSYTILNSQYIYNAARLESLRQNEPLGKKIPKLGCLGQ